MLRGPRTLNSCLHFEAISYAPRVTHPQFAPSHWSYFGCTESRTVNLHSHIGAISRTLNLYLRSGAISQAPRVTHPQFAPSEWRYFGRSPSFPTFTAELYRMLRGPRAINLYPHSGAIPHAPMVTYPQFVASQWGYFV